MLCVSRVCLHSLRTPSLVCVLKISLSSECTPGPPGLTGLPKPPRPRVSCERYIHPCFWGWHLRLATILLLKFTKHFKVRSRRLTQAAMPFPGPSVHAPRWPPGSTGAHRPPHTPRERSQTAAAARPSPRGRAPLPQPASCLPPGLPRLHPSPPLPGLPRRSIPAPAAASLGSLSLATRRSPALAGRRLQDGRGASGSCGGLEAEAEPSHSCTPGLRSPAPGCSLLPAAAMRGSVHGWEKPPPPPSWSRRPPSPSLPPPPWRSRRRRRRRNPNPSRSAAGRRGEWGCRGGPGAESGSRPGPSLVGGTRGRGGSASRQVVREHPGCRAGGAGCSPGRRARRPGQPRDSCRGAAGPAERSARRPSLQHRRAPGMRRGGSVAGRPWSCRDWHPSPSPSKASEPAPRWNYAPRY